MPKLEDKQNSDAQYDPFTQARDLYRQEEETGKNAGINASIDQINAYATDPKNASADFNRSTALAGERSTPTGLYNKDAPTPPMSLKDKAQAFVKKITVKKAAPAGIIGALVGGFGLLSVFLGGAFLPVTLVETVTNDLNDSTSWNEKKTMHLFSKKLKPKAEAEKECAKGKVACGLATFDTDQIEDMEREDSRMKPKNTADVGDRVAVGTYEFTDEQGNKSRASNPAEFDRLMKTDVGARSAMNHYYNPKTSEFFGTRFAGVMAKWKTSLAKKIKGETKQEAEDSYKTAVSGADTPEGITATSERSESNEGEDGERNQLAGELGDQFNESVSSGNRVQSSAVKLGGALALPQLACASYQVGSIVSAGSKLQKAQRLAIFAGVFLTGVASMKAGDITQAESEKMTDVLVPSAHKKEIEDPETGEMIPNPYYGKNALDSQAYKIAAFGDDGDLNQIAGRFLIGGGVTGMLSTVIDTLNDKVGRNKIRTGCKVVNNKAVNFLASLAAPMVSAITAALAVVFADQINDLFAAIINKAIEAAGDADLTTDIVGAEAGDAIFAGTAVILGGSAQSLAMKPGTKSEILAYAAERDAVQKSYIAVEQYNAKDEPLNAANKYSFLGSLINSIRQPINESGSMLGYTSLITKSLQPSETASAAYSMPVSYTKDTKRFDKCNDDKYEAIGTNADMFCNVRYVPFQERPLDATLAYMIPAHADPETAAATSEEFIRYKKYCVDRTQGWGEFEDETGDADWSTGKNCMVNTDQNIWFANFIAYIGAQEDMDSDPVITSDLGNFGIEGDLQMASSNVLGSSHTDGPKKNKQGWPSGPSRIKELMGIWEKHGVDVVGVQEFEPNQRATLVKEGGWSLYPTKPDYNKQLAKNSVIWRTDRFDLVEGGDYGIQYFHGKTMRIPWAHLKEKDSDLEFIVISTHDPASVRGDASRFRYNTTKIHIEKINTLKQKGVPVFIVGDFNSQFNNFTKAYQRQRSNLSYCMLTASGYLKHAYDVVNNSPDKPCPSTKSQGIDHVYVPSDIPVTKWEVLDEPKKARAADHPLAIAHLGIGSEAGAGLEGGIAWPVNKKYWDSNKSDFIDAHFANSGTWTSGVDSLAVDIGVPPDGSPVYAMFGGKVSRSSLGGHGLEITSQIQGGTLKVAYAHGPRTNQKTEYKAGDEIMKVGCLGNCDGGHVHIDMAFNGRGVCPQDIFIAMGRGDPVDLKAIADKSQAPCGGRTYSPNNAGGR